MTISDGSSGDSEPRLSLSWYGRTDVGRFRKNNEDAFLALTFNSREVRYLGKDGSAPMDGDDFIFAVSDGMGGAKAGEFASKIAVDKITDLLPKTFSLAAMGIDRGCTQILRGIVLTHTQRDGQYGHSLRGVPWDGSDLKPLLVYPGQDVFRSRWRQPHLLFS